MIIRSGDSDLGQRSKRGSNKWSDSEYIWEVELIRFIWGADMDIRKKEQSSTTVLVLSNYKNEVAIEQNGDYCENNTVRGKYLNSY